jgi:hypothetical protein
LIDLSEEEQLAAVIAESLAQQKEKQKKVNETEEVPPGKKRKEVEDQGAVSIESKKLKVHTPNDTSNHTLPNEISDMDTSNLDCVLQV